MPAAGLVRFACYAYLAQPAHQRVLHRAIRRLRPASIVELGVGDGRRAQRLIESALRYRPVVRYAGVDLFEAGGGTSLKAVHQRLRKSGAAVRLIPGDPLSALAAQANSLTATDLLLISSDQQGEPLAGAWFFVPRMLGEASRVYLEEPAAKPRMRVMLRTEIDSLAAAAVPRRTIHRRAA